jgi:hypothetical protein
MPIASQASGIALFPQEIIWAKLLITLVFFLSVLILFRIAKLIHPDNPSRYAIATWAFALSPFALFAFGIFSQYDILGVFFTLWAFHKLLQRKLTHFAILIGIALTFKFFAALFVLPLILLSSKRIIDIIKLGLISTVPLVLQLAAYWSNESFRDRIFGLVSLKAGGAVASGEIFIVVISYVIICLAAVLSNRWRGTFEQKAVLFTVTSYGLMLSVVAWHPQWLIILTPFLALMVSMISAARTWILWESLAFVAFVGIAVTEHKYNVDGLMIEKSSLASLFPSPKLLVSDFYPDELMTTFRAIMRVFFWSPPFLLLIEMFRKPKAQERLGGLSWASRVAVTWLAFIGPAFVAIYLPLDAAVAINRNAAVSEMRSEILSNSYQTVVGEISKGVKVTQSFVVSENNFSGVRLILATYARENSSFVNFNITDGAGKVVHSEGIAAAKIEDNLPFALAFDPQAYSAGKEYTVTITSSGGPGSSITAYASAEDSIPGGVLVVGGAPQAGDLSLVVYFTVAP